MLTPDATERIYVGSDSFVLNRKLIPFGTRWNKNYGTNKKGDLYKEDKYMTVAGVTIHNTIDLKDVNDDAEQYTRATFNQNMGYARVHYYIDDVSAWQNLLDNEVGWHAGDGLGAGNFSTIAIEIIMDGSGSAEDTDGEKNGAMLAAWLLFRYGLSINQLYTHNHWMGQPDSIVRGARKNCPVFILPHWEKFKARVAGYLSALSQPIINEEDKPLTQEEKTAFETLQKRVTSLESVSYNFDSMISNLNEKTAGLDDRKADRETVYKTIQDVPEGEFRETVQKLLDREVIDNADEINMTYDKIRLLVTGERDKMIFHKISDIPEGEFRETVQKLADKAILKGSGSEDGQIIVDLPYESIRILVLLERQGVFG